jgi:hypothetical protein
MRGSGRTISRAGSSTFAANGAFSDNLAFADREKDQGLYRKHCSGKFHNQAEDGVQTCIELHAGPDGWLVKTAK